MEAEDATRNRFIGELTELSRRISKSESLEEYCKRLEEALRESEERYRRITEAVTDYIFTVRIEDGRPVETIHGPACVAVTGYTAEEYAADPYLWFRMVHEEDHAAVQEQASRILLGRDAQSIEHRIVRKDGVVRWVKNTLVSHYNTEGTLLSYDGLVRDITERKQAEEALRGSEAQKQIILDALVRANTDWENTFDAITDLVLLLDSKHQIICANKTTAKVLHTTKENLVGKKCYEVVHGINHPINQCPLAFTMKTLGSHTKEIVIPHIGGTFICSTSPIVDEARKLIGYVHTLKDITESKRLESKLQQAQKMEAIGTLAGGIAHDFNNLLTGILGNASLMFLGLEPSHPNYKRLKRIEKLVISGVKLTGQLLGYARKGRYEVKPINLNQVVKETSDTVGRTRKQITIRREFAKDLLTVEADPGQIEQVLLNLFVNAADAMPGGGDLILKTMNTTHEHIKGKVHDPRPGNYVVLTVADKGIGMDKGTMQRIFDPFFTTKEMGRGTGLGLASAYGIIKGHGGYIDVESRKGHGTTFRVYLPASKKKVQKVVTAPEKFSRGSETILLVDDEDIVLEASKESLEAMGYRVFTARDGKEAVEVYETKQDEIDLVLLDMIMPNMGGGEAYDRMKAINPDVKVLLASGYSIDGQATEILNRGCNGFIQKPINLNELSQKIKDTLEKNETVMVSK